MIKLSGAARARIEENIETLTEMGDAEDRQEAADLTMLLKAHDVAGELLAALRVIAQTPDPATGDRGPVRHARHIAKCAIAKAEGR